MIRHILLCLCGVLFAAGPALAGGHAQYRDRTPSHALGQPQNARTLNLALFDAAAKGWTDEIGPLLEAGASVTARNPAGSTALILAAGNGHRRTVQALLAAGSAIDQANLAGSTALLRAAEGGHARTAKLLIEAGAAVEIVNSRGVTPLAAAAFNGDDDVVALLLARGAAPATLDRTGKSPIVYAAAKGFAETVRLLLAAGVPVDARYGNELTALMWAAGHANDVPVQDGVATVEVLLEHDASPDLQDDRGRSALMIAAEMGHAAAAEALLAAGARSDLADRSGKTAMDLAVAAAREDVVALLGATPAR